MQNLISSVQAARLLGSIAAGTTSVDTPEIEVGNFDSLVFIVTIASQLNGGVLSITPQHRDNETDAWASESPQQVFHATADRGPALGLLEFYRPAARYFRMHFDRTVANTAIESVVLLKNGAGRLPVSQDPAFTMLES